MNDYYYPPTINRAVLMVVPRKPFYDWLQSLDSEDSYGIDSVLEHNSYLLEDTIMANEPKKVLKKHWKWIFENELFGHYTYEEMWPPKRTWKMFTEWFDLKFSTIVLDLVEKPLEKEE